MVKIKFLKKIKFEHKITFSYLVIGFLWILFSDEILLFLIADKYLLSKFQTFKGSFFIAVTAMLLFYFVRRHFKKLRNLQQQQIENENRYKSLFYGNHSVMLLIDTENQKIADANPAALEYYGYTHDEIISLKINQINTLSLDELNNEIEKALSFKQRFFLFKHRLKSGEIRDVEVYSGKVEIDGKSYLYSIVHDISEKKRHEIELQEKNKEYAALNEEYHSINEELRLNNENLLEINQKLEQSEAQFRLLVENAPEAIFIQVHSKFAFVNKQALKLFGAQTGEQLINTSIIDRVHPDFHHIAAERIKNLNKNKQAQTFLEQVFIRLDGSPVNVEVSGVPFKFNQLDGALVFARDITLHKIYEEALIQSTTLLNKAQEIAHIGSWSLNLLTNELTWMDEIYRIFGFEPGQFKPSYEAFVDAIHPEDKESVDKAYQDSIKENRDTYEITHRVVDQKSGELKYVLEKCEHIRDDTGKIVRSVGMVHDITEQREAAEKLEKSHDLLNKLAERVPGVIYQYRLFPDGRSAFPYSSPGMFEIYEVSSEEVRQDASPVFTRLHPEDYQMVADLISESARNQTLFQCEFRVVLPKQGLRWRSSNAQPQLLEDGSILWHGIILDITDRKIAEEGLRQSEDNYRRFLDESNLGIRIITKGGKTVYVNNALLQIFGFTDFEEFINTPAEKIYTPDEVIKHKERKQKRLNGEELCSEYEVKILLKNGNIRNLQVIRKEISWNNASHFQIIYQDITDKKTAEQELILAKEKAEESDRLKSAFLNNMSHEVRTPLNAIAGFSQFLARPGLSPEKAKKFSELIMESSDKLIAIIADVIDISHIHARQLKLKNAEFDLFLFLKEIEKDHSKVAEKKNLLFNILTNIPGKDFFIISDRDKLKKIFNHLIDNAIKFTSNGSVELNCRISDNKLNISVTDTGIGIPNDLLNAVFEPFRQVETGICRNYGGTGLGLPIVKAFTELLRGKIDVESELNNGTRINLEFPISINTPENIKETPIARHLKTGAILIAEDETSNYQYLLEILEETGLKIIHAQNGKQAVDACLKDPSVNLVLMDIKMPVMDGHEAATSIKAMRPDLPIIAQTAYALSHEIEKYQAIFNDYITKPIDEKELLKMIEKYFSPV